MNDFDRDASDLTAEVDTTVNQIEADGVEMELAQDEVPAEVVVVDEANADVEASPVVETVQHANADEEIVDIAERLEEEADEDLREFNSLPNKKKWAFGIGVAGLVVLAAFGIKACSSPALDSGPKVEHAGYTFNAPQDWVKTNGVTSSAATQGAIVLKSAKTDADNIFIQVLDNGKTAKSFCDDQELALRTAIMDEGVEITRGDSPVVGREGCTIRAVGNPRMDGPGFKKGEKIAVQAAIVADADGRGVFTMLGTHNKDSKYAGGQIETSILKQVEDQLKKG